MHININIITTTPTYWSHQDHAIAFGERERMNVNMQIDLVIWEHEWGMNDFPGII